MFPSPVGNILQCVAGKLVTVLTVGYCVRHKN